ncbi:AAA domain-containing protein [Chryseobacterium sp.]|uniref:DEAD/DEAH box helicase n=1 Tax=Chryseobacterium sp. TaxID=1871047 RepID=UPI0025BD6A61|nr:AAA domain-containing protein [Chryseobacterium sp.]MBV8326691.1 hypothetical protein [Chryseobacterium sp.]
MNQKHYKWLTYWKKNLTDSLNTNIEIDVAQHFEIEDFKIEDNSIADLKKVNTLIDFEERRINEKRGIKNKDDEDWITIDYVFIVIAPFKLKPASDHLVHLRDKKPKFPFWYSTYLDRNGKLYIPDEMFPLFQRQYLEPLADERTEFIFGSIEEVDLATTLGKENYSKYPEYVQYVKDIFKKVTGQQLCKYQSGAYETIFNAIVLLPQEEMNAAMGIIELYEKILHQKNLPELLQSFITLNNNQEKLPITVPDLINTNELHLGQMGFDFPISISQRKSLNTLLGSSEKVFAVNGPPGTGKTTLLQSIVANKMVESALKGEDAPIILACSTNNQAVTNIIDSFSRSNTGEGKLQGRWIPDIDGYATYLPSTNKKESELKGINYKKLNGNGLFNDIENSEFLQDTKEYFLQKSNEYFNSSALSLSSVVQKLQTEISDIEQILQDSGDTWKAYLQSEHVFTSHYLLDNSKISKYYHEDLLNEDVLKNDIENLTKTEQNIIIYFSNEPFFRKFFCFLGIQSALKNRASEVKIILRDSQIAIPENFVFKKNEILDIIDSKINTAKKIMGSIEKWKLWKNNNSIKGNPPRSEEKYWEFEHLKIKEKISANCFYDELDISLRHKAFQLALHYWEGRYLLQLESDLFDPKFNGKGKEPMINRWKRHAMLTPCFFSTFYMAPKFFSFYKFLRMNGEGNKIHDNPPLFNFIDLLIVDEAGQVSPEVGIATFALAKQAVVVGDVKQIEPIWNVTHKIDIGNLKKCEIIEEYDDIVYEKEFDPKGFLSSTGSIMKMAQNASGFKEANLQEKGVLLTEHRRCYDEIINYCNVLAYDGKLIPLRGKAKNDLLFPPMHCIHVDGQSTRNPNGSRFNIEEVKTIINWLTENKTEIEKKYECIEHAVGIITPFTGQKNSLKSALKDAGFKVEDFKIGTVHALQGAERPIILFSMVYGDEDKGTLFFDRDNKPNMLNVAVSRAKDNFVVFANTKILDKNAKTPSGVLANFLKYNETVS